MSTGLFNSNYAYLNNIGTGSHEASLPIQTIPESKKTKKWQKIVADRLEHIGLNQLYKNAKFIDYRDMYEGRLVYQDLSDVSEATQYIDEIRKGADLPSYIKHFDIIGKIANQLVGEYNNQRDMIRVDSIDNFSKSEFLEEKNRQIREFAQQQIDYEIKKGMAQRGVDPNKVQEFESDEQKQLYLQQLQQIQNEIIPPEEREARLKKDFKTVIAEWAEATLESDFTKFDMETMDTEELLDYILTGRYFRHYHIGYDFYKPETWKPEVTFFSEDLDIRHPQDGEYVGRILFISPADFLQRYGDRIPANIQEKIYETEYSSTPETSTTSLGQWTRQPFGEPTTVPYKSYYERELAYSIQNAMGIPMGKYYYLNDEGEQQSTVGYLDDRNRTFGRNVYRYAFNLRKDIDVRSDVLQVTEAYFRGYKLHGILTLESPITETPFQTVITEDLLKDFIDDEGIKKLKSISIEEAEKNPEPNTIAWFYLPTVYKIKKLNASNTRLKKDYVFDYGELEYQIRGDSNHFDVKLPVAGLISSSVCQKIRPYQVKHNLVMNLIENAIEKHIGQFMVFDFNFLASQYKLNGDEDSPQAQTAAELVEEFRSNVIDTSMAMFDSSPSNTGMMNPNAAVPQMLSVNNIQDVQYFMNLAQMYKMEAYEQIGITRERAGSPNEYMTAEGVRQGVNASYAQTERIYKLFNSAKRKERELHLTVAQFAVKDNKDITVNYLNKDDERIVKVFTDEKFWLRKIDIVPVNDSSQRRSLEQFRNVLMENNTSGFDLLDFARVFTSDSFVSLIKYAQEARERSERQVQEQRQHEQKITDIQNKGRLEEKAMEQEFEAQQNQLDRENRLREQEIDAIGTIADNNGDMAWINSIREATRDGIAQEKANKELELKERDLDQKKAADEAQARVAMQKLNADMEKIALQREKMQNDLKIAQENKNRFG